MSHRMRVRGEKRVAARLRVGAVIGAAAMLLVSSLGCSLPLGPAADGGTTGSLSLSVGAQAAKTLLPGIDLVAAEYVVSGSGPAGASFTQSTTAATSEIGGLAAGTWTVSVTANNQAGQAIGRGSASVAVKAGKRVGLSIQVRPLEGNGTLSLALEWPAADVGAASVEASLLPPSGSAIPLVFSTGSGSAACENDSIPGGYYTLSLRLLDGGTLVMGAVEVVRIAEGAVTSGAFVFSSINKATATISVSIAPLMNDPLAVDLAGAEGAIAEGTSLTATASIPGYADNATFVYYLNGEAKASASSASPSWTFGSDLPAGSYRLDVAAFSADGQRAGSASRLFSVVSGSSVALEWDQSAAAVGYRLYRGLASGSYDTVVDAGSEPSATSTGLLPGETYYFAVTAYEPGGEAESGYSNEIAYTVPL